MTTFFARTAFATALLPLLFSPRIVAAQVPAESASTPAAQTGGRAAQPPQPFLIIRADPGLDAVISTDAKLDTIATIPLMAGEAPMWREGKLWVSDQKGGRLFNMTTDGKVTTVIAENAGGPINPEYRFNQGPNGLITDKDNSIIFMRQAFRDMARLMPDGTIKEFLSRYEGKRFNAPNDGVFGPDGALWFTDPPFSVPGFVMANPTAQTPAKELPFSGVFRYKDGKLTAVITDMALPNGIGLSPDGKTLYVDNTGPVRYLRAYDLAADGTVSNQRVLYDYPLPEGVRGGGVDGLKVDSAGNVWSTGPGGISIISPAGKLLGRIQLPTGASNLAFGEDLHSVFFTCGPTVYRLHTIVAGEKPLYYRP